MPDRATVGRVIDHQAVLEPIVGGRRVLCVCGPIQSKTAVAAALHRLSVAEVLVIGSRGTGPRPDADCVVVDLAAADPVDEFRQWERIALDPPAEVADAVARFDPDLVLTNGFESVTTFAGRPVYGARRPAWTALEDKVTVDALWDEARVDRAPVVVTAVRGDAAWQAHQRLHRGAGTVWAGDARDGWHGGGELVRRVRSRAEAEAVQRQFGQRCDLLRVMPFLEGLPCSIHGFVTRDGVAALRPVEMVVLRTADGFRYCGTATSWDPTPEDRDAMRRAARRVGEVLRQRCDYRGFFTIDGVMTGDGFRPTELNPRLGAGLRYVADAVPDLPLPLLQFAEVEGDVSLGVDELESTILPAAEEVRNRSSHTFLHGRTVTEEETLVDGDVTIVLGPGTLGAFLRASTTRTPPAGRPFAPTAARALALADAHWQLGLGELTPAPLVR